jgi:hypothetical protein
MTLLVGVTSTCILFFKLRDGKYGKKYKTLTIHHFTSWQVFHFLCHYVSLPVSLCFTSSVTTFHLQVTQAYFLPATGSAFNDFSSLELHVQYKCQSITVSFKTYKKRGQHSDGWNQDSYAQGSRAIKQCCEISSSKQHFTKTHSISYKTKTTHYLFLFLYRFHNWTKMNYSRTVTTHTHKWINCEMNENTTVSQQNSQHMAKHSDRGNENYKCIAKVF